SVPWTAARLLGAHLNDKPQEQWLRYYGWRGWKALSYHLALSDAPSYFNNKIIFVGGDPSVFAEDAFRTPRREVVGGVKILATTFLNLMNGDWLRRPPWWAELLILIGSGAAL